VQKPTLQQTVDNNTHAIKALAIKIDQHAQGDELPPYNCIPNWRVQLARDRALEPTVTWSTKFTPALKDGKQVICACSRHKDPKPMLVFHSGDEPVTICTYAAWWAICRRAIQQGKWRTIPQTPAELYRSACENVR